MTSKPPANNNPILKVEHLRKSFGDSTPIKDVTFSVNKGDVISIIGPSGVGKSTILRCINQLTQPSGGDIYLHEDKITDKHYNITDARKKMGMVFQSFNLFNNFNVIDNIVEPQIDILKKSRREAYEKARELLRSIGLEEKAESEVSELSGGQKQRIAIVRSIALEPDLLLLDEPTSALDPSNIDEVLGVIRALVQQNMTMIIVTHEMNFAKSVSNKILYIDEGVVYEQGSPEQIFNNPQKEKTRAFVMHLKTFEFTFTKSNFKYYDFWQCFNKFLRQVSISKETAKKIELLIEEFLLECALPCVNNENKHQVKVSANPKTGLVEIQFILDSVIGNIFEQKQISEKLIDNIAASSSCDVSGQQGNSQKTVDNVAATSIREASDQQGIDNQPTNQQTTFTYVVETDGKK